MFCRIYDTKQRGKRKYSRVGRGEPSTVVMVPVPTGTDVDDNAIRGAFDHAAVGMAITSLDGKLVHVNPAFAGMLGFTPEELRGTVFGAHTHPDDLSASQEIQCALLSGRVKSDRFEKRYLHREGHIVWGEVSIRLLRDDNGRPLHFIASVLDITERKQREEELRKAESLTRTALENLPLIFYVVGADGVFQLSVGAGLAGLGLEQNQAVGLSVFDLYREFPEITESIRVALAGKPVTFESHVASAWYHNICAPFSDALGRTAGIVGVALDVSAERQIEQALRNSETSYRALVRGLPDMILRFDREGRHLFASDNVEAITGIQAKEFLGKTHRELGFDETRCALWEANIARVFRDGVAIETEFELEQKGTKHTFNWRLIPEHSEDGHTSSALSISRNVTKLRRAENDYKRLFREMLDGLAVHEIICDDSGRPVDYRFLEVNPAFERLTGLRRDEIVGRTALEVMPSTEAHWIETYGRVALTGEPTFFESESAVLGKYFQVTAFCPVHGQFVCIFADITLRKTSEAEKARLEAQLHQAQRIESIGRLAGGVAHDFNNMLGVILGSVELIESQRPLDETIQADLTEIRKAAERSAELTGQLLAFARQQPVVPRILNLNETIAGMLNMLRRLIGESVTLSWHGADDNCTVRMDPSQITQILANLCVNARDAIADVGTLTISTCNVTIDASRDGSHERIAEGQYVRIAVEDSGSGMHETTLSHIFEPFFTTKGVGEGTGLGLAMVYGAVSQNGGYIDVQSKEGKGSTFHVYLPRHHGEPAVRSVSDANALDPARPGRVLLLEDEPVMLSVVHRLLESHGYTVLSTRTPAEAIAVAKTCASGLDLLLTDVVMPEMNGRELAGKISEICPNVKVLYMSGFSSNILTPRASTASGLDFIEKPFHAKALLEKIRSVLGSPK